MGWWLGRGNLALLLSLCAMLGETGVHVLCKRSSCSPLGWLQTLKNVDLVGPDLLIFQKKRNLEKFLDL